MGRYLYASASSTAGIGLALMRDPGCIDKRSSAELSEAINSMYQWYANADACYVYLTDVPCDDTSEDTFCKSNWFTRGWTVQELLAPMTVQFCDSNWTIIGDKHSRRGHISRATGISSVYLDKYNITLQSCECCSKN